MHSEIVGVLQHAGGRAQTDGGRLHQDCKSACTSLTKVFSHIAMLYCEYVVVMERKMFLLLLTTLLSKK